MNQEQLQKLHTELLEILLDVQKLCEKHNISFFLGEGTLLGAVRHQGFIPWDDDIDILMKRSDYERFLQIAQLELKERYLIQHPSTVYPYWSTFIKVRVKDANPTFYQQHIQHLTAYCGPCIDIFPLEYVSHSDSIGQRFQFAQIRLYRRMIGYKLKIWHPFNTKTRIIKLLSFLFPFDWLQEHTALEMRRQGDAEKDYIAAFSTFHKYPCVVSPKEFYETDFAIFEGHRMPIPAGFNELLTKIYGNWHQVPPEEKRFGKHQYFCTETL